MESIKIKYFDETMPKLKYVEGRKSDWIDLMAAEDMFIEKGEFAMIPLGVAMQLPEGYEAHIVPRSSTFKTYGIIQTNHMGIIDESYCGPNDQWFMPVFCLKAKDMENGKSGTKIKKNKRICQFRIVKHQPEIIFDECKELGGIDRNGFGSTGK